MWDEQKLLEVVRKHLPPTAEICREDDWARRVCVRLEDVDGDGMQEIVGTYHLEGNTYIMGLKVDESGWQLVANLIGSHRYPHDFHRGGAPYYWYYLAEAQLKANMPQQAVKSIESGWRLKEAGPSRESWLELLQQVRIELVRQTVNLFPASVKTDRGTKWGYINDKGQLVIDPRYDFADDFQENGLAIVTLLDKNGLIDKDNKYVIVPKYDTITRFSQDRAAVVDAAGFHVINDKGEILTDKPYSFIGMYQEGRALFSQVDPQGTSHYGYLDREGKEVIPATYQSGTDFHEGRAVVQARPNEFILIGRNGERLHTFSYANVGQSGDGLLAFQETENGPYGYVDENGNVVIPPRYLTAQPFEKGRAIVNAAKDFAENNQYGLIDKKGTFLIPGEYNDIHSLKENRVAVGKARDPQRPYLGSKFAIADTDGKIFTDFLYNEVMEYQDGKASANDDRHTFFINRGGQIDRFFPMLEGSGTLTQENDLVKALINQRVSYYTRTGNPVWRQNTVIPLTDQYRVREELFNPNKDYIVYYPRVEGMSNKDAQNKINDRLKDMSQVKPIPANEQLDYSYSGDFSVEFFRKQLLELLLVGYNFPFGAAHGMPTQTYAHIDLVKGKMYQLKDLFKPNSNYVKVLSDIVGNLIKNDPQYSYVFPGSYKGIKPDQPFYVKQDALYLYFAPYEIGPYAAGFPTFRIPFAQIMDIIDTEGDFWQSFH
ncbi:UNVERIFIED_CONTAM: hypothetical protein ABID98_005546 [Brevibacillus sp. OAP136]